MGCSDHEFFYRRTGDVARQPSVQPQPTSVALKMKIHIVATIRTPSTPTPWFNKRISLIKFRRTERPNTLVTLHLVEADVAKATLQLGSNQKLVGIFPETFYLSRVGSMLPGGHCCLYSLWRRFRVSRTQYVAYGVPQSPSPRGALGAGPTKMTTHTTLLFKQVSLDVRREHRVQRPLAHSRPRRLRSAKQR